MRTAKRTGYQRPAKNKRSEKQDDRFLTMVCFQMALCILAAAVFFAACRAASQRRQARPSPSCKPTRRADGFGLPPTRHMSPSRR